MSVHLRSYSFLFAFEVFGDKIIFMNVLSYRPGAVVPSAFYIVDCVFDRLVCVCKPAQSLSDHPVY